MIVKLAPVKVIEYHIDCESGYSSVNAPIEKELLDEYDEWKLKGNSIQVRLGAIYHELLNNR